MALQNSKNVPAAASRNDVTASTEAVGTDAVEPLSPWPFHDRGFITRRWGAIMYFCSCAVTACPKSKISITYYIILQHCLKCLLIKQNIVTKKIVIKCPIRLVAQFEFIGFPLRYFFPQLSFIKISVIADIFLSGYRLSVLAIRLFVIDLSVIEIRFSVIVPTIGENTRA